jgi:hypothetical protein
VDARAAPSTLSRCLMASVSATTSFLCARRAETDADIVHVRAGAGLIGFGYCNNTNPTFTSDVHSSAHCSNVTGRWLNPSNGIHVDMVQTSPTAFTASCEGGEGWKNVHGTNVPGGIDLHYGPTGDLATFGISGAGDAPPCSLLKFESGNVWCREPFCSAAPAPSPAPAP